MDEQFKKDMCELYRRLQVMNVSGFISRDTYNVGVQLAAQMAIAGVNELIMTWDTMAGTLVWDGRVLSADAATTTHYNFLGVVHELEEVVGLISHVDRDELEAHILEGREERGFNHFSRAPGVLSNIIGPKTLLIFTYEPWVAANIDERVAAYVGTARRTLKVPKWLAAGSRQKHAANQA